MRTAGAVASNSATIGLTATSTGAAADLGFEIPAGTRLRDPETGLIYEVSVAISLGARLPAVAGQVRVTFEAEAGQENREIVIPAGTRVEDYNGLVYTAQAPGLIPAPENRQSAGEVRFVPEGGEARDPITVPTGTVMVTATGARFEVVGGAVLNPGDRAVTVPVRALPGSFGVDASPGELRLETPIAGLASATNRLATQRPASVEVQFIADAVGASDRSDSGRIKTLLTPVAGARFAYAEAPQGRGGSDPGVEGVLLNAPEARATVIGPVGEIRTPRVLELVDPSLLPAGVSADDVQIIATGTLRPAGLVPAVLRSPGPDGRPDLPTDAINVAESADIWRRTSPGSTARIKQSDAAPEFDARNIQNSFDYAAYFQTCRSGVECPAGIPNPLDLGGGTPLKLGSGPTHRGDGDPASLRAGLGFFNFEFDLAEAATLLAGPAEGEEFSGTQADIVDVALITQHSSASDVTRVLAPYGDVLFAAEAREVIDEATGLPTTLAGNVLSGVTVAGPGALQVQVGVTGNGAGPHATGVGGRLGLSDVAVGDSSARGIETVGNLSNPSLGAGSASIDVVTAGNIELNDRGSIDTLQGGDIHLTSLGGALIGGQPEPAFTAKRGVFTLYVPGIGQDAATSGGGSLFVDVFGDFDIGLSVAAALSGGDIVLHSRTGSISAGAADPFEIIGVNASPTANLPEVRYRGGGIFASDGSITIVAEKDVDIGAGITGGAIAIAAGGNINAGTGAISSSGNVSIDAGGTISGTIQASGAVSIGSGTVTQSASIAAGGLVVGAGSVGSNTGPGKVSSETAVASGSPVASQAAAQSALAGGQNRRSGVNIDVTSRPANGSDDEDDDQDEKSDEG